jgi:hypothetical protein
MIIVPVMMINFKVAIVKAAESSAVETRFAITDTINN